MGITFCGLVLLAICTAMTVAAESCLGSEFKDEVSVVLWESLFTKMNTLGDSQNAVSESLRAVSEDQKALSESLRALTESQNALSQDQKSVSESQRALSDDQKALTESQKAQTEGLKALSGGLRALSENLNALTESQKALSESLTELKEKHEAQGRKLSEFMEYTEKHFSILEESQAVHQSKLSNFMDIFDNNVGWTTILRRQDGSVDFYRNWSEYKKGFGKVDGEFFIGLEILHDLTTNGAPQELLIILKDNENEKRIAKYDLFKIGNETEKYALLELGAYSGDATDSLIQHKGRIFTTYDQDNDNYEEGNCAEYYHGAWWFDYCYDSHLFGNYTTIYAGIDWNNWKRRLKFAEMKIRPK